MSVMLVVNDIPFAESIADVVEGTTFTSNVKVASDSGLVSEPGVWPDSYELVSVVSDIIDPGITITINPDKKSASIYGKFTSVTNKQMHYVNKDTYETGLSSNWETVRSKTTKGDTELYHYHPPSNQVSIVNFTFTYLVNGVQQTISAPANVSYSWTIGKSELLTTLTGKYSPEFPYNLVVPEYSSGITTTEDNGLNWSVFEYNVPSGFSVIDMATDNNGTVVVISYEGMACTSRDSGLTWTAPFYISDWFTSSIVYDGTQFVVHSQTDINDARTEFLISLDGLNWDVIYTSQLANLLADGFWGLGVTTFDFRHFKYKDGTYYLLNAISYPSDLNPVYKSTDLITWSWVSDMQIDGNPTSTWTIEYIKDLDIWIGPAQITPWNGVYMLISTDNMVSWSGIETGLIPEFSEFEFSYIKYGNGKIVMVIDGQYSAYVSEDGYSWTDYAGAFDAFVDPSMYGLTFANNKFYSISETTIGISEDTISWMETFRSNNTPSDGRDYISLKVNAVPPTPGGEPTGPGYSVDYLIVAGGGGGGYDAGGGGGAGGLLTGNYNVVSGNSYFIIIGAGGAAGYFDSNNQSIPTTHGVNGSPTNALYKSAIGGGGGGTNSGYRFGYNGGSGGGASIDQGGMSYGYGRPGQGNIGCDGNGLVAGSGGGASSAASIIDSTTTHGGNGLTWLDDISYAGGGGGGANQGYISIGGLGGGGAGGMYDQASKPGTPGQVNTGGGGGGGSGWWGTGAPGGSGIVIIRYLGQPKATGGTITHDGLYTWHRFTTSGIFKA